MLTTTPQRRAVAKALRKIFKCFAGVYEHLALALVPIILKIDLDETQGQYRTYNMLKKHRMKYGMADMPHGESHVRILHEFKAIMHGRDVIQDLQQLEARMRQLIQQLGPHAVAEFGLEWVAWTRKIDLPMPTEDGSTIIKSYPFTFISAKQGQYVYCKLPLQFDQAFIEASKSNNRVQNTMEQSWQDYTMDNRNADADHQYIVIKVPENMTCYTDVVFSLKLGLEAAAGRSAYEAAQAVGRDLPSFMLRVMTRNMRPAVVAAMLTAIDPEGRVFSMHEVLLCDHSEESIAAGKPTVAGNIFDQYKQLPAQFQGCVVIGADNKRHEMVNLGLDDLRSGLAACSVVCEAEEVSMFVSDDGRHHHGNAELIVLGFEAGAKVAGYGDLDLFQMFDDRGLQQRHREQLRSTDMQD